MVRTALLLAMIVVTALAMGLRNATVRRLKVPDLTTTVLTLTSTGLAADSSLWGGDNASWLRRVGAVFAIFAGAAIGAALVLSLGLVLPLILCGGVVIFVTLAFALHPAARSTAHDAKAG